MSLIEIKTMNKKIILINPIIKIKKNTKMCKRYLKQRHNMLMLKCRQCRPRVVTYTIIHMAYCYWKKKSILTRKKITVLTYIIIKFLKKVVFIFVFILISFSCGYILLKEGEHECLTEIAKKNCQLYKEQ